MFDTVTKKSHDTAIKFLANMYVGHTIANGGKCKQIFVNGLVIQAQRSVSSFNITRHDIRNKVGRIQRRKEKYEVLSSLILLNEYNESSSPTVVSAIGFTFLGSVNFSKISVLAGVLGLVRRMVPASTNFTIISGRMDASRRSCPGQRVRFIGKREFTDYRRNFRHKILWLLPEWPASILS
jgi:hypothetical protein